MNNLQVKKYFENYVKNYKPYRHIPEYSKLIDTLIGNYTDDSYININAPFKKAYEEQIIPKEFYNNLLLSIGFPSELIATFTEKDKIILLSSFMDFNKYKGTVDQFQKIGYSFDEPLSIYELYIDYRTIEILYHRIFLENNSNIIHLENDILYDSLRIHDKLILNGVEYTIIEKIKDPENVVILDRPCLVILDRPYTEATTEIVNFSINRWVFVPRNIYNYKDNKIIDTLFPYIDIYLGTYHYFVSIEELEGRRLENDIILPIKSNLIFIDYNRYQEINVFNNLLSSIFLKEYYNTRLTIFFKDGDYSITLGRLYKLWYYILMKFYDYNYTDTDIFNLVMFDKDHYGFDYNISDIDKLVAEYNKIKTADQYGKFYNQYIESKLKVPHHIEKSITLTDLDFIVRNELGADLIDYIDKRINFSTSELEKYEYNFILDEIYNSIITWVTLSEDNNIKNNFEYLVNNMSRITYSIDMSPSYNLIKFVKPYHVELISELSEFLRSDGNGNIVNTDMLFEMYLKTTQASVYTMSEQILSTVTIPTYDDVTISSVNIFGLDVILKDFIILLSDYTQIKISYVNENTISVSTLKTIHGIESQFKSILSIIQDYNIIIEYNFNDIQNIFEKTNIILDYIDEISAKPNTLKFNSDLLSILKSTIVTIDKFGQELILDIKNSNIIDIYYSLFQQLYHLTDITTSSDIKHGVTYTDNININHFIFFVDHLSSWLLLVNLLVDIILAHRIKIDYQFTSYQYISLISELRVITFDDDTSLVIDNLPELIIDFSDFETSLFVENIANFDIIVSDVDTSGYIDIGLELNIDLNKKDNLIVSHTYNFT